MGYVPSHRESCVKVRSFPTFCQKCFARVIYFECSCGSKVFFDPPREGEHLCLGIPPNLPSGADKCMICGRPLTDPVSQAARMGPVCRGRHDPACEILLRTIQGRDVNASNQDGVTRMHVLARLAATHDSVDALRMLGDFGAREGVNINAKDVWGETPLHYAAGEGAITAISMLVGFGSVVNMSDHKGNTPLHAAAAKSHFETAIKIAGMGALVYTPNKNGEQPIHLAVMAEAAAITDWDGPPVKLAVTGYLAELIDDFVDLGADVTAWDNLGMTPLHYALSADTVGKLADHGAYVDSRDKQDRTPLHCAAEKGGVAAIRALLGREADVNARDARGKTPLDVALERENQEIAGLLRKRGGKCGGDL